MAVIVINEHRQHGKLHREDGPAIIWANGEWAWWLHGKVHRYYGAADKVNGWFIHGSWVIRW